jgi:hypothetical protein
VGTLIPASFRWELAAEDRIALSKKGFYFDGDPPGKRWSLALRRLLNSIRGT